MFDLSSFTNYLNTTKVTSAFVPTSLVPTSLISSIESLNPLLKLLKGDVSDVLPLFFLAMFVWFASTKLFSWTINLIFKVVWKLFVYLSYLVFYLLCAPFAFLRMCCQKAKICHACRCEVDMYQLLTRSKCCRKNFHESCFIENLAKKQLMCPGCTASLHPDHFDLNLKAGLYVLQSKRCKQSAGLLDTKRMYLNTRKL